MNESWSSWYENKTVLITGATSGIGFAMAQAVAPYCKSILLVGRNEEVLKSLPAELMDVYGVEAIGLKCDLSERVELENLISKVTDKYIVDVLINNAGFGMFGPFVGLKGDVLRSMVDVNITALSALTLAFAPQMKERDHCGILNVGSVASFFPIPGSAMYGATKYFVRSFTEALARECGPHGVHVSGLYPGVTYSGFLKRATSGERNQWKAAMTPEIVASAGLRGLAQNQLRVVPGLSNKIKVFIANHVPVKFLLKQSKFKD